MRELRIGLIALGAGLCLALVGCDGDGETDAGPPMDDGSMPGDGGDDTDAGPMTMMDSGPPTGMGCGPTGGECTIDPANAAMACPPDPGTGAARGCLLQGGGGMDWMTACFPVGVVPEGGDCDPTMAGQCGAGYQCFGDPGSATCARLCCNTTDCNPGDRCVALAGAGPDGMMAGTCRTPVMCDPLSTMTDGSNMCPMGQGCYPQGDSLGCFGAGTAAEGDACMTLNGCAAGHGCINEMGSGVCRRFCNPMDMPTTCPMNYECAGLTGFTDLGFCRPMM